MRSFRTRLHSHRVRLLVFLRLGILQRCLAVALGSAGLAWGINILPSSEAADDFRFLEGQLLQSATFNPDTLTHKLATSAAQVVRDCDTHSQTALLLVEMQLAQAALRAGAVPEFEERAKSMEFRLKRTLACEPRQSFVWLLAFSLDVMHGRLNEQALNLLAMSYQTSPNEAWIALRRMIVAIPLVLIMPEHLKEEVLGEFQQLVQDGFSREAALPYSSASASIRALLRARIERLDPAQQKLFWDATRQ
jgi:hypothetical protein